MAAVVPRPGDAGDAPEERHAFGRDVRRDLGSRPKRLQSRYLYDALGSRLFDAICCLPWYHITRAETRLLTRHVPAALARLGHCDTLADLGPGSGEKTAIVVEANRGRGRALEVHLVDVSAGALAAAAERLARFDDVSVVPHRATYACAMREVPSRPAGDRTLVLFLGSNVGNFEPPDALALLRVIREGLRPGDGLLLGADLVKPEAELRIAYDDPLGLTAAFNKNLLVRINAELGGDFALDAFEHRAVWNASHSRVEMHLVSRQRQRVSVPGAGGSFAFEPGETIWTESSYKYQPDELVALGRAAGFEGEAQWVDPDARFALSLFRA
ncbi:MAG TPA: L-histidine N(alpha)-methyltransferase [Thermodesulfobacteriota bacterium]